MVHGADLHLDGAPNGAQRARAFAASVLGDVPDALLADAQLVLTELVSNAGLHGRPPIVVFVGREDDGAVRVEVEDAGRQQLMIPVPSADAMTGRGLSLVTSLAADWGIDPGTGGGKRVWALLRPGAEAEGSEDPPLVDVDAILAGWHDVEPEELFTVRLGSVPTDLLLGAKRHMDNVVRELTLVRAGAVGGLAVPAEVEALVETVTESFVRARAAIKRQAAAAAVRGDVETELTLTLPASSAVAGERYLTALDEIDRYARDARLLTLETPPLHALFRRWYVQALVDQLRALSRGEQPAPARPFVQVLSDEVTALSALRTSAQRLGLLQKINAELAAAGTRRDLADVVVRNVTEELDALAARVMVAEGDVLRTLAAAGGSKEWLETYREVPLSGDLPASAVFRTGEPWAMNRGSAAAACLSLPHAFPDDRSVHLAPVTAGRHRLGVLVVAFPAMGELAQDAQGTFVRAVADALAQALELHALRVEFESDRQRWDVAIDAAGVGSFDWDLLTGRFDWDERLQALFGYGPGEPGADVDDGFERIDPQDRPALDEAIDEAIKTRGDFRAEYRVRLPDGQVRWLAARGRVFPGPDGAAARMVGTAHDISEARSARDEAARLMATMATGFLALDHDWRMTYLNTEGARVVGVRAEDVVGRELWEAFPGLDGTPFGAAYRHAMATRQPGEVEGHYAHLNRWYQVRMEPSADGLYLYFTDITDRRGDRELARGATERLQLLADASEQLAAAGLDVEGAVARLSHVVSPALADWCLVSLVDASGQIRDVGHWHSDPSLRPVLDVYVRERLNNRTDLGAVHQARERGETVVVESGATEWIMSMLGSEVAKRAFAQLRTESGVAVPLVARGSVIGALTMCRGRDRPPMTSEQVTTAQEIASRAALALDNARLYTEQRGLAEALQRSLMSTPPQPEKAEIAVRYVPAAKAASVGGDWYDAFLSRHGSTVVVIGDVMGHDTEAAAGMGQLRGLLRGIAWHTDGTPSEVLTGLDAAMRGLQIDTTATAVVARLEPAADDRGRAPTQLRWSNAGHPPPLLVAPDGAVEVLIGDVVDLLLGFDPSSRRNDSVVTMMPSSTVLLYTDGLIERRGQDLDAGLQLLRTTLAEVASLPLSGMCDEVLRRMLPLDADDDAALVAVRLHHQGPQPHATA